MSETLVGTLGLSISDGDPSPSPTAVQLPNLRKFKLLFNSSFEYAGNAPPLTSTAFDVTFDVTKDEGSGPVGVFSHVYTIQALPAAFLPNSGPSPHAQGEAFIASVNPTDLELSVSVSGTPCEQYNLLASVQILAIED